jgi:hypothetical protein
MIQADLKVVSKENMQDTPPGRPASHNLPVPANFLPVVLAAPRVDVDLANRDPALVFPKVAKDPKHAHDGEGKVGFEEVGRTVGLYRVMDGNVKLCDSDHIYHKEGEGEEEEEEEEGNNDRMMDE